MVSTDESWWSDTSFLWARTYLSKVWSWLRMVSMRQGEPSGTGDGPSQTPEEMSSANSTQYS